MRNFTFFNLLFFSILCSKAPLFAQENKAGGPPREGEPGYYQQWFEKHKNEQGIVPDDLTEQWFAHDQAHLQVAARGTSPIQSVTQSAPTTKQGGRTRALLIDQNDPLKMWAGCVSGGLWRSTDGGQNWVAINDQASTLSITCIVQNPLKPNEIYYGTGEVRGASQGVAGNGLFKSTDYGLTFDRMPASPSDFRFCNYLAHSPIDSQTLYIGTSNGLYFSINGGTTFTKMTVQPGNPSVANNGILCHPDGSLIATIQGNGIYRRAPNATSFTKVIESSFPGSSFSRVLVANCAEFPNVTYAMFFGSEYDKEANRGLFKSSNFGQNWTKIGDSTITNARIGSSYQAYCQVLGVHPVDTNRVVFGAVRCSRTIDGGKTYQSINEGHSDNHVFVQSSQNNNQFFLGNDGGIYRIDWGNTQSSTNMNGGYITHQYYAGNYAPRGLLAMGGLQDNGTWRHKTGAAQSIYGADGGYSHISQQDTTLGYVATQNGNIYRSNGVSQGAGGTFTDITDKTMKDEGVDFINQYEINYADGTQLYNRTNKGLWRTENKGGFWDRLNAVNIAGIQAIGVTRELDPTVFLGGNNCFFRADNALTRIPFDTLKDLRNNVPTAAKSLAWGTISIHPKNNDIFYVGMTNTSNTTSRVFRVNETRSDKPLWTNLTGNLPLNLPVYQVQPHPDRPDSVLLAASAFGLYVTTDSGRTWVKDTRVPNVPIFEMKLRASDRTLFLFTHGRGLFFVKLNDLTKPVSGTSEVAHLELEIFPNPANDWLNIAAPAPLDFVQIFDLSGRELLQSKQVANSLNISDLRPGQYLLKAYDAEGRFAVKRFVVN